MLHRQVWLVLISGISNAPRTKTFFSEGVRIPGSLEIWEQLLVGLPQCPLAFCLLSTVGLLLFPAFSVLANEPATHFWQPAWGKRAGGAFLCYIPGSPEYRMVFQEKWMIFV